MNIFYKFYIDIILKIFFKTIFKKSHNLALERLILDLEELFEL